MDEQPAGRTGGKCREVAAKRLPRFGAIGRAWVLPGPRLYRGYCQFRDGIGQQGMRHGWIAANSPLPVIKGLNAVE